MSASEAVAEFGSNDRLISSYGLWSGRLKAGQNLIGIESMTCLGPMHPGSIIACSISIVEGYLDGGVGRNLMGIVNTWLAELV